MIVFCSCDSQMEFQRRTQVTLTPRSKEIQAGKIYWCSTCNRQIVIVESIEPVEKRLDMDIYNPTEGLWRTPK